MLISLLIFLLISNAVTLKRDQSILFSRIVVKTLVITSFLTINILYMKPLERGVAIYGGLFNVTTFTQTFNTFIFIISGVILTLTSFYPRKVYIKEYSSLYKMAFFKFLYNKNMISNKTGQQFRIIEYALIIVFILCGAVFLMTTADLVSVFLSIELQSYGLYILCTLYKDSESATGSGLTYFLLGGLSSCFILLGSGLLYANSGTTSLDNIYIITSISETEYSLFPMMYWYQPYYLHLSLIVMFVGFLFKVSAAPFHFWSPDVYDGIPTLVTTFVAIIPKISIFAFFLELVYYTQYYFFNFSWSSILVLSSMFSLIIGSILGLTQTRFKRLFAYSTISHVGFILLALSINSVESIQSYIFYIIQYTISNLNAFIILLTIGYYLYLYTYKNNNNDGSNNHKDNINRENFIDKDNSPIQWIDQIRGYFYVNHYISMSLAITLFSFIGIPPMIGFFGKQMVLSAALDSGYIFMSLIAILTSVIGAGYYLNVIKLIFFYKSKNEANNYIDTVELIGYISPNNNSQKKLTLKESITFKSSNIKINSSLSNIISVNTLLIVTFIYAAGEWYNIVSSLTLMLFKA